MANKAKATTTVTKTATKVNAKAAAKSKAKGPTIGAVAIAALSEGKGAEYALAAVKKQFPEGNTKMASIYWYASQQGIKLQGTSPKATKEKVVHKVAVPAKKAAKKAAPKATAKVAPKPAGKQIVTVGKAGRVNTKKPVIVDADAAAADKAASAV